MKNRESTFNIFLVLGGEWKQQFPQILEPVILSLAAR